MHVQCDKGSKTEVGSFIGDVYKHQVDFSVFCLRVVTFNSIQRIYREFEVPVVSYYHFFVADKCNCFFVGLQPEEISFLTWVIGRMK